MAHCPIAAVQCMLTFQAVGVGEAHDNARAREQVMRWINNDWVSDLVVELPSFADAGDIAAIDARWPNTVRLSTVINLAAGNNVRVHQWDDWFKCGVHPGSADGVANRNRLVAEKFLAHFTAVSDAHHCVMLFGANHFGDAHGFENLLPGLKWADLAHGAAALP